MSAAPLTGTRRGERLASAGVPTEISVNTNNSALVHWHFEFAKVIGCEKCTRAIDPNLLRDNGENVPQPGYIGAGYERTGLLLVGQNPGVPPSGERAALDKEYTAALRALHDKPTAQHYAKLQGVLDDFIPTWRVHEYFPLEECGLALADIAYLNLVRCRTEGNARPADKTTASTCRLTHFEPWLNMLKPSCVVFIGLWACGRGRAACVERGIHYSAINRNRGLTTRQRQDNRVEVIEFVRQHIRSARGTASGSTA